MVYVCNRQTDHSFVIARQRYLAIFKQELKERYALWQVVAQ